MARRSKLYGTDSQIAIISSSTCIYNVWIGLPSGGTLSYLAWFKGSGIKSTELTLSWTDSQRPMGVKRSDRTSIEPYYLSGLGVDLTKRFPADYSPSGPLCV